MVFKTHGAASAEEKTILPSELLAHTDKYDGKHMVVRPYVVIGPEERQAVRCGGSIRRGSCGNCLARV